MIFAIWNVRSLFRAAAIEEVMEELIKYRIDLCAIQEIRWPKSGILSKKQGILYYNGSSHNRNQFGTGIFVSKKLNNKVTDFQDLGPRICKIRFGLSPHNITIISVHAPTEDTDEEEKAEFYEELEKAYDHIPQFDMKIIMGDFNSKIGKENIYYPTIGKHSLHNNTNNNGSHLMDFAMSKGRFDQT